MVVMTVVEEDIHRGIVSKIRKIIREEVDEFQWIRDIEPVEYRFFEVHFCEEMNYWTPDNPDGDDECLFGYSTFFKVPSNIADEIWYYEEEEYAWAGVGDDAQELIRWGYDNGYLTDQDSYIEYVREVTPEHYTHATFEDVSYYTTKNIKEDLDPFTDDYIVDIDGLEVGMTVIPTCLKERPFVVDNIFGAGNITQNGDYIVARHVELAVFDDSGSLVAGALLSSNTDIGSSCLFKVISYDKTLTT